MHFCHLNERTLAQFGHAEEFGWQGTDLGVWPQAVGAIEEFSIGKRETHSNLCFRERGSEGGIVGAKVSKAEVGKAENER